MTDQSPPLKPIGWAGSLLYFGIPCALFSASILGLLPWMIRQGHSVLFTFFVTFGLPLAAMLAAALVWYRREGHPWTWSAFRDRMRLRQPTVSDWVWAIGLVGFVIVAPRFWAPVAQLFAGIRFYTAPSEFVTVMTGVQDGTFGGLDMTGRWDVLALMTFSLIVLNIGGEELWWRGIILPRQELAFGKWTWLVHGMLWNLFHFFYHTSLASVVSYMVSTLSIAFVAQRTRNTWPGIIAHIVGNSAVLTVLYRTVTAP